MSNTVDADAPLVDRTRSGERAAFDQLATRHYADVERLVTRYLKNAEEARDVTQAVFLRAFENLHSFRGTSSFRTWLYRVAISVALNYRSSSQAPASWLELEDDMAFTRSLGTTRVTAAELSRKVFERVLELPPKQRLVAELRLFQDLSFGEIAVIAACTENAAKVNFQSALKHLRELAPKGEED